MLPYGNILNGINYVNMQNINKMQFVCIVFFCIFN